MLQKSCSKSFLRTTLLLNGIISSQSSFPNTTSDSKPQISDIENCDSRQYGLASYVSGQSNRSANYNIIHQLLAQDESPMEPVKLACKHYRANNPQVTTRDRHTRQTALQAKYWPDVNVSKKLIGARKPPFCARHATTVQKLTYMRLCTFPHPYYL